MFAYLNISTDYQPWWIAVPARALAQRAAHQVALQ